MIPASFAIAIEVSSISFVQYLGSTDFLCKRSDGLSLQLVFWAILEHAHTARHLTTQEYLVDLAMIPHSQGRWPPVNEGQFASGSVDDIDRVPRPTV